MCDCTDHKDEIPAYDAQAIESRWMKAWEDSNLFAVDSDDSKPKKYVLEMFPYPSGDLHMGHARNYTIGDAMARQARMRGFDVLHPIGFDAFGLPAENAAIKHNTQAAAWTYKNMDQALATMKRMGFSYDLDRMVKTCSPDYYRWGQWIFEKLWEKGLVYRKKNPVNWCPTCKTVLANEQVTEGKCWRCGTEPEKRDLEQWYYKITEYSQELLDDLEKLPGWPERVKQMQANWIGRSEGAEVDFTLCDQDGEPIEGDGGKITVFTTRADTLFGVSFFVLAPEYAGLHELVEGTEYEEAVTKIVEDSKHISAVERAQGTLEKHGAFTGRYVVNPVNGEKVPVWVADYVVADYGTGAVMAVPCGDQRDFEFARKYDLPIVPIILDDDDRAAVEASGETIDTFHAETVDWDCAHAAEGTLVQSGKYTGMRGGKHSEGEAASQGRVPPARLAHQPPALLGQPHPGHPLRALRHRARARGSAAGDAAREPGPGRRRHPRRVQGLLRDHLPGLRPPGQARDRYHGHLYLLQLVLPALYRPAQHRTALLPRGGRPLDARR